jgi:hypothetical protein
MKKFRGVWITLIVVPLIGTAIWTILPTLQVIRTVKTLPSIQFSTEDSTNPTAIKQVRRNIQKHFRDSGIYIPTEDILTFAPTKRSEALLMQKVCGKGTLFVWVPLKVRLPFVGERIKEWCFKVESKTS